MCQEFPKEKWVDARKEDVLDAPYFHVVFTVPEGVEPCHLQQPEADPRDFQSIPG